MPTFILLYLYIIVNDDVIALAEFMQYFIHTDVCLFICGFQQK